MGGVIHFTNGENAASGIRSSAVDGLVVSWNDVLHEGPVPAGLPLDQLRRVRAQFIAGNLAPAERVLEDFGARDRALVASLDEDEIVLWFEHDLYDQLQLLQILDWYAAQPSHPTLTMICRDEYLGPLQPEQLRDRFPSRTEVTAEQKDLARRTWAAFREPDPTPLIAIAAGDTSALPYIGAALRRHFQQFPSVFNGLSRSEQQALEAVAAGAATLVGAYIASHHRREEAIFLGDTVFAGYMEDLACGDVPLVTLGEGDFRTRGIALTDAGRAVMAGKDDRVRLNGLDRWFGGVHLTGRTAAWRSAGDSLVRSTDV
jgi:hypothetical protein